MFAVNIMFSLGNVIPLNLFDYGNTPATCGQHVVSPATGMVGLGLFLGGKFSMVLYELFIVSVSLMSLRTGKTEISRRTESAAHALCIAFGLGLFVGWAIHWTPRVTPPWNDLAADLAGMNTAEMDLLRAWLALLVAVVVLWGWSRVVLRQLELEWDEALVSANAQWDRDRKPPPPLLRLRLRHAPRASCACDVKSSATGSVSSTVPQADITIVLSFAYCLAVWKTDDPYVNGQRIQKRRLLDLRREGYRDVAKPLEACEFSMLCWHPGARNRGSCLARRRSLFVQTSRCSCCSRCRRSSWLPTTASIAQTALGVGEVDTPVT